MKKKVKVLLLSLLVIATAAMIFCFSAESAAASGATSARVTRWLLETLRAGFGALSAGEQQALIDRYGPLVRKAAHFTEFFLLGFFLRLLFQGLGARRKNLWAVLAGALYAVTDEMHQIAVSGRAAMARDVLIDCAGVLCGALAAWGLSALAERIRKKRSG